MAKDEVSPSSTPLSLASVAPTLTASLCLAALRSYGTGYISGLPVDDMRERGKRNWKDREKRSRWGSEPKSFILICWIFRLKTNHQQFPWYHVIFSEYAVTITSTGLHEMGGRQWHYPSDVKLPGRPDLLCCPSPCCLYCNSWSRMMMMSWAVL